MRVLWTGQLLGRGGSGVLTSTRFAACFGNRCPSQTQSPGVAKERTQPLNALAAGQPG